MPRLMGVDIPNDKQIQYSLTYLYGTGLHTAREVCEKLGIDPTRKASDIHEDELNELPRLQAPVTAHLVDQDRNRELPPTLVLLQFIGGGEGQQHQLRFVSESLAHGGDVFRARQSMDVAMEDQHRRATALIPQPPRPLLRVHQHDVADVDRRLLGDDPPGLGAALGLGHARVPLDPVDALDEHEVAGRVRRIQ